MFLKWIAAILFQMGGFGLLVLGVLDSSFLIAPLGNDLLIVALTASHHVRMPFYAAMATGGSVLGCYLMQMVSRKAESGLEKSVSTKKLRFVEKQVEKHAGWALAFAAIMPPPFPFTPFVAAAAAFDYPKKKMLSVIAAARFFRFTVEGALAIRYGERILTLAESPKVQYAIIALIVIAIGASAFSIYSWIRKARYSRA